MKQLLVIVLVLMATTVVAGEKISKPDPCMELGKSCASPKPPVRRHCGIIYLPKGSEVTLDLGICERIKGTRT